jgi:diguanylate cyclase (GGDEF)-like protein
LIYSHSTKKLLKNLTLVDLETRGLTYEAFQESLHRDLIKANQLNVPGALVLIKIDDFVEQESLFSDNPMPAIISAISEIIKEELTALNIFGRIDEKSFGVYFFNSTTKSVFVWAEKSRVKVARNPITLHSKQTTFTVSIGIASTTNKTNVDEILYNANLALSKAVEKGGNTVLNIN